MIATKAAAESVVPPAERAPAVPSAPAEDGHIDTLLRALTASWRPVSIVAERRREERRPCDVVAKLVPLDKQGKAVASAPLNVRVRDISQHGVGISHSEPMAHRVALIEFETRADGPVRLVVRLKWCRFKRADLYESGGQILRVLKPGEDLP
jgi:hypothetical protein